MTVSDICLVMGGRTLYVNPWQIKVKQSEQLHEKITQARIKNSPYAVLPFKEGETQEEWSARYKEYIEEENKKQKEETAEQFIKRSFDLSSFKDNMNYMFDVLCSITSVLNSSFVPNREAFDDTPVVEINNFIVKVLKRAKVPIEFTLESDIG